MEQVEFERYERLALWHVPSGPLPLLGATEQEPTAWITDPWSGWQEKFPGADTRTPFFGAGHPGVIWLNLSLTGREPGSVCGMSSFEWIGDRYRSLRQGAKPETDRWWKALRRSVQRITRKVPRQSIKSSQSQEIFAFPDALKALESGGVADQNP